MGSDLDSLRPPERASVADHAAATRRGIGRLRHLPAGVVLLAVVQVVIGATALLAAAGLGPAEAGIGLGPVLRRAEGTPLALGAAGLGALITAVGLLDRRRWAWVVTMLYVGATLVAELILWARGTAGYLMMGLSVVAAFYLNQASVRDAFARPRTGGEADGREPPVPTP